MESVYQKLCCGILGDLQSLTTLQIIQGLGQKHDKERRSLFTQSLGPLSVRIFNRL